VITFRDIQPGDEDSVVTPWKCCALIRDWNAPYRDIAFGRQGETSTVLVGIAEGRLVASVMAGHDGHRGVLYYLAVDPDFRNRGFGKAAVAAAETWLRA
jgi:ribosomal protein S18 acetylase RimI-like enzyme